jgi:hypothetical protein
MVGDDKEWWAIDKDDEDVGRWINDKLTNGKQQGVIIIRNLPKCNHIICKYMQIYVYCN